MARARPGALRRLPFEAAVSSPIPAGKLPAALLRELLGRLPPAPPELRLGPAVGEDACAIDLPAGTLVVATDPITLTGAGVGRHAVLVNANDVAVMGVRPRWFLAAVLLPLGTGAAETRALFESLAAGLAELAEASGVALRIDPERMLWFEPGRAVCRALGADPWGALASGALLGAFPPERAAAACEAFAR